MKDYKEMCEKCKHVKYAGKQKSMFCNRYKEKMCYCSTINCYGNCKHFEEADKGKE